MKRTTTVVALLGALLAPGWAIAQNLLTNGDLGSPVIGDVAPTGWTLTESPADTRDPATLIDFADHTTPGPDNRGIWFKPFEGNFPGFPDVLTVDADLTQKVSGTPGQQYKLTGWARFEGGYAGGVDILDATSPNGARASLTDTVFALEFLDGLDALISDVRLELKAAGQLNDNQWKQHTLLGTAPAGTASVRVRAAMIDGEFNADLPPGPGQSAFVDDFALQAVPEPASWALGMMGVMVFGLFRRWR